VDHRAERNNRLKILARIFSHCPFPERTECEAHYYFCVSQAEVSKTGFAHDCRFDRVTMPGGLRNKYFDERIAGKWSKPFAGIFKAPQYPKPLRLKQKF